MNRPFFRTLCLILCSSLFFLQGCSWRCGFYIANTTNEAITVEIELEKSPGSFPIFHYPRYYYGKLHTYNLKKNNSIDPATSKELKADTLERYSHFTVQIPPHTALEIGQLQNDNYKKYDQVFINGRKFNLEKLSISNKKIEIVPSSFDKYFKKGKYNEVYFVL